MASPTVGLVQGRVELPGLLAQRPSLVGACVTLLVCTPILFTQYLSDDNINRLVAVQIRAGELTLLGHISEVTMAWIHGGRFFPGSFIWTYSVFDLFIDRLSYKSLLLILSVAAIATVAIFARWLSDGHLLTATLPVIAATWSLRLVGYDPLDTFAGLLPLTIILALLGTMAMGAGRRSLIALGAVAWVAALITYEVAILVAPAAALALWVRGARRPALGLGGVAFVDIALALILRHGKPQATAYMLNLAPGPTLSTAGKQALATFPGSGWLTGVAGFPFRIVVIWSTIFAVATTLSHFFARRSLGQDSSPLSTRNYLVMMAFGLSALLGPALLIGATLRWQQYLVWGTSYLGVAWQYVGLSLITIATMQLILTRWDWARRSAWPGCAFACAAGAIAGVTFALNLVVASGQSGLVW